MPVLDGYAATQIIREKERGTSRHIPIVALTASVMIEDQQRCHAVGMDYYVPKPVERRELFETLAKALNKQRTQSAAKSPQV